MTQLEYFRDDDSIYMVRLISSRMEACTGEFLSISEYAGLILCSDGVPLFKSSGIRTIG